MEADSLDNAYMEQAILHANLQIQHQYVHHINTYVRVMMLQIQQVQIIMIAIRLEIVLLLEIQMDLERHVVPHMHNKILFTKFIRKGIINR